MFYSLVPTHSNKENVMDNSHISALNAKHHALEAKIRTEMSRPMPDTYLLAEMKKRKLRLKEELAST